MNIGGTYINELPNSCLFWEMINFRYYFSQSTQALPFLNADVMGWCGLEHVSKCVLFVYVIDIPMVMCPIAMGVMGVSVDKEFRPQLLPWGVEFTYSWQTPIMCYCAALALEVTPPGDLHHIILYYYIMYVCLLRVIMSEPDKWSLKTWCSF